jgi:hypothetical protein
MTRETVLLLLAVMTISVMGAVALWAGMSQRHWFLRVAVVGAVLSLWMVIPAYEILAVLFVQATVVIVFLWGLRLLRARRLGCQFTVRDLLLLTALLAIILSVAISAPKSEWTSWLNFRAPIQFYPKRAINLPSPWIVFAFAGFGAGVVTLVAAWAALGQGPRWLRLAAVCLIPPSWLLAGWLALLRATRWIKVRKYPGDSSANESIGEKGPPTLIRVAKIAAVLVSVIVLLPLTFVYYRLATPPPIPPVKLPNPNGYNDLLEAGELFRPVAELDVDTASPAALRAFVPTYRHVFDTARRGLDRDCQVLIRYTCTEDSIIEMPLGWRGLRSLARAFIVEGKLAEAEGRTDNAIESYLDTIRLGRALASGGIAIDTAFGLAVEGIGRQGLHELGDTLTSAQCRKIIDTLVTAAAGWEPPESSIARDIIWRTHAFGWQGRLEWMISSSSWLQTDANWNESIERADKRCRAKRWLLICEVALQGHRAEHGEFPDDLADLVPGYLSAVPKDPFSNKPFIYRRQPTGYLLYSVGPDGKDDGGRPFDYNTDRGDIRLDPPSDEVPE